jgi:glycosyltransferase involved in cell wall biosynthesis
MSAGRAGPGLAPAAPEVAARSIRVLHVIDSLPPGGAETVVAMAAHHLSPARFASEVCSLHAVDPGSPVVAAIEASGTPLTGLRAGGWHDPRHVGELARLIRRGRVDLVHAHLPYAVCTSALAAAVVRVPLVATVHSVREYRRGRSSFTDAAKAAVLRRGPDAVIACGRAVWDEVTGPLGVPAARARLVPNAIDVPALLDGSRAAGAVRRELLGGAPGPLLVAVGSHLPAKGHVHLIEALPVVLASHPGAVVAIAGRPGPAEAAVASRARALGVAGHVRVVGVRRDVPALSAAADAFVLPSEWEGLPLALLEAMAVGTPVVATAVGGVPEVVEDGVTGFLVPPGDSLALGAAVVRLLADPARAKDVAAAAAERVRRDFGVAGWVAGLEAVYDEVLAARGRAS